MGTWSEIAAFVRDAGGFVDDRLCLDRVDGSERMRSVFARADIEQGDEVFRLPSKALLGLSKRSAAGVEAGRFVKRIALDLDVDAKNIPQIRNGIFALFMQQLLRASLEHPSSAFFTGSWAKQYPISLSFGAYMRMLAGCLIDNIPVVRGAEGTIDWSLLDGSLMKRRIESQLKGYRQFHAVLMASAKARSRLASIAPLKNLSALLR